MKFSVVVHGAPYSSEAASTALNFTRALLDAGHEVYRLFFFSDGVHNANRLAQVAQDEVNLQTQWHKLISSKKLDAAVCVSSAIRRGIVDRQESERRSLDAMTLHDGSEIAGLGQLVDAALQSDRMVHFG